MASANSSTAPESNGIFAAARILVEIAQKGQGNGLVPISWTLAENGGPATGFELAGDATLGEAADYHEWVDLLIELAGQPDEETFETRPRIGLAVASAYWADYRGVSLRIDGEWVIS